MQPNTSSASVLFAVCPRVELSEETEQPRVFSSELEANEFLDSEVQLPELPPEREAALSRSKLSEVLKKRALASKLRDKREAAAKNSQRGNPHLLARRNRGWRIVGVCNIADHSGPKCTANLRDSLPLNSVAVNMPPLAFDEEFDRAWDGRTADYTCFLAEDWRFATIAGDASQRLGHEYVGRRHSSVGEIVVQVAHDLEAAFQRLHPIVPCSAAADFWRSWQTQQHIAAFCCGLAKSDTARSIAGGVFGGAEESERARVRVCRILAAFAHELSDDGGSSLETGAASATTQPKRKPGRPQAIPDQRKAEAAAVQASNDNKRTVKEHRAKLILDYRTKNDLQMSGLGLRVNHSSTAIYGMINGDATRYSPAALKDFLQKIGVNIDTWNTE